MIKVLDGLVIPFLNDDLLGFRLQLSNYVGDDVSRVYGLS